MKWYFALTADSLTVRRDLWEPMLTAAVLSARRRTSLSPHLGGDDPFLDRLRSWGVTVIHHRVSFHDALVSHRGGDAAYMRVAAGTFLRIDLPLIDPEDGPILYTDCDVFFEGEVDAPAEPPALFACAPEFDRDDFVAFNAGVMMVNLAAMRASHADFVGYIRHNLADLTTFDQDAYRRFYAGRADRLPLALNWKPYWGVNEDARIVHFHGPKPPRVARMLRGDPDLPTDDLTALFHRSTDGYREYMERWRRAQDQPL